MKLKFGIHKPKYEYNISYAYFVRNGNTLDLCHKSTTCTDYLTDLLMYPDCKIGVTQYGINYSTDLTQVVISYYNKESLNNFIKTGLPLLHIIERANGFKLTKVLPIDNHLVVFGSKLWMHSTYTLSMYLKIFRNFHISELPKSIDDLPGYDKWDFQIPLLWKIALTGKLRDVNKGCKYKHGWRDARDGTHSNNGIHFTLDKTATLSIKPDKNMWGYGEWIHSKRNFLRLCNMVKLEKELEIVDAQDLWSKLL